jgi:hypothetical protein
MAPVRVLIPVMEDEVVHANQIVVLPSSFAVSARTTRGCSALKGRSNSSIS